MKISASLYSNKVKSLEELVKELDALNIDSFHIDCNDNPAVFDDIAQIRKISGTPIDLHIISSEPEKYLDQIVRHEIEYVQFQYEDMRGKNFSLPKNRTQYGLAVVSDTPLEIFEQYQDQYSFILLMTTTPGQSGGVFRKDNFNRIRRFGKMFPAKKIHVDGGVNDEVSFILRSMGVDSAVSGSFLVNHTSMGAALMGLKMQDVSSHYQVKDIVIDKENLPVLDINTCTFPEVLQAIESFDLGFTLFTDNSQKLAGIASNADVRRGLLNNIEDFNQTRVADVVNTTPISIREEATISDMLALVTSKSFPILFLPVVNANQQLTGAVTFNNLIRGEV
ncbi:ribulose-phosphate 3-epimerase [Catalinimonas alkaloidigena]|uniref:CBS domain-containing protein n=1 Tax=Catalinimonas alkaloidigena TaxID=1075417 RepID=UPI002406BF20|nr:CBS domain-containing protein [Catalinimonas alkaloidigena]MDF9795742.1 ribulose-phosphate 3-epimerase [Catalinimonas alkaloidigena]